MQPKTKTKGTSISLSSELMKSLRERAAVKRRTVSSLLEEWIRDELSAK
jgi:predicted transcriptional regulator